MADDAEDSFPQAVTSVVSEESIIGIKANRDTASLPLLADFHDNGCYQAQARSGIGKQDSDPRTTTNLAVESFQTVSCPQTATMFFWKRGDGQSLGNVLFHPVGQVRSCFAILPNPKGPRISSGGVCSSQDRLDCTRSRLKGVILNLRKSG
jgi:hypothetical protein